MLRQFNPKLWKISSGKSKGFTLTELIVAATTAAIFMSVTVGIVVETMKVDRRQTALNETQAEVQLALDYIRRDFQDALFIYSDTTDGAGGDADGIPDLNQVLTSYIPNPANSRPVLAFWKVEALPQACYDPDTGTFSASMPALDIGTPADPEKYRLFRRMYTLVVYYLRENDSSDTTPWEGPSRVTRVEIPGFRSSGGSCERFYDRATDPVLEDFVGWPYGSDPSAVEDITDPARVDTLVSSIDFESTPALVTQADCPDDVDTNGNLLYSLGASNSLEYFYACVRKGTGDTPQDALVYLRGNALGRSDQTNAANRRNDNLLNMQTQVFARGVFGRSE
jgi:type II secretory pathway pseudopilin PulG